jgi:acyl-CoA synthetase (AMP-forming)/AMP-acid ligase II
MGPAYYVISIFGCADGSAQCVPAATMPVHYATEATCKAAQTDALIAVSDLDFPSLVAQCTAVTARPASADENASKALAVAARS